MGTKKHPILMMFLGVMIISGCSKPKEPAPFFDGLYLKYQYEKSNSTVSYSVEALENGSYNIVEKKDLLVPKEKEYLVDRFGIEKEGGEFTAFWLPVHKLELGDTVFESFKAVKIEKWKHWETMVFEWPTFSTKLYYDLETGFNVGSVGKVGGVPKVFILTETNADLAVE